MTQNKTVNDLRLAPFELGNPTKRERPYQGGWHGQRVSVDGTETSDFSEEDVVEVMYHGNTGSNDWDGTEAAILKLKDGRLVAYEGYWGPTGDGFHEDAYGGEADLFYANESNLNKLVLELTDTGRRLCGIPVEGLENGTV